MDLGEFSFIDKIKDANISFADLKEGSLGIGDDCAVIPYCDDKVYLVSKDALIEGVHFSLDTISFKDLGFKSIAVNLSDIAAMGGVPLYILISLSIPKKISSKDLSYFYEGVKQISKASKLSLLGGDTSRSLEHFMISVTIIGSCLRDKVIYRHGACIGDNIYITGMLGDSAAGLLLLDKSSNLIKDTLRKDYVKYLINRHIKPKARVEQMQYLNALYKISAGIDISDGLASDLGHILRLSNCGAIVDFDKIPKSKALLSLKKELDIKDLILSAGEDYEVLFTSKSNIKEEDIQVFEKKSKTKLTKIGSITKGGFYLNIQGSTKSMPKTGYDHFVT